MSRVGRVLTPEQRARKNERQRNWYHRNLERAQASARERTGRWAARNREALREKQKAWAVANPDKARESKRRWNEKNPETRRQIMLAWREANKEHVKAYAATRYWADPDQPRQAARRWRQENLERARERDRHLWLLHPDKVRDKDAKRRARLRGAKVATVSRLAIYERDHGICQICRRRVSIKRFNIDHIVPLKHGGTHEPSNVQITHPVCNFKKGPGYIPSQVRLAL